MDDLISRQAAIDALGELATFTADWSYNTWMYTDDVYNAIKQLPPIQPTEPQIIYCKDCKLFRLSDNGKFGICKKHKGILNSTDFCSFAERMEVDNEQET